MKCTKEEINSSIYIHLYPLIRILSKLNLLVGMRATRVASKSTLEIAIHLAHRKIHSNSFNNETEPREKHRLNALEIANCIKVNKTLEFAIANPRKVNPRTSKKEPVSG